MRLEDFPNEIIQNILHYLSFTDILNVALVCKKFRDVSNISEVWKIRSFKDYRVNVASKLPLCSTSLENQTEISTDTAHDPKEIYFKLLHPYGCLLGLWQASIASYSGLLQIKYEGGFLHAFQLIPPKVKDISEKLKIKKLFAIGLVNGSIVKQCFAASSQVHDSSIAIRDKDVFNYRCSDISVHRTGASRAEEFAQWLEDEQNEFDGHLLDTLNQELLLMKFLVTRQYNLSYEYNRLRWPSCDMNNFPISPGLFKGTYGAHGLELIMLSYEECGTRAKAQKITGDPNVPANQITFCVNLNFPILNLPREEQESLPSLNNLQPVELNYSETAKVSKPEKFYLPLDCNERSSIPSTYTERYHGWGQIASHGFTNPSFSKGHWIIFSDDIFGFLWIDLKSISMYHRVSELSKEDCY